MHRILSYDHQPASNSIYNSIKEDNLKVLVGLYSSPVFGQVIVSQNGKNLTLENNGKIMDLLPNNPTIFFIKDRNIEFHFTKGVKFDVIENGKLVDVVKFIKS